MDTREINIGEIIRLFIKNIKIIIPSIVLFGLCFFIVSYFFISPKYVSNIYLYVNNKESEYSQALNINDLNASQKLVNTYIVILKNDEMLKKVGDRLLEEYSTDDLNNYLGLVKVNGKYIINTNSLRNVLTMGAVDDTEVLKIEAETKNPQLSASICQIIAEEAPSVLKRIVKAGSVEVIGTAEVSNQKSSPNNKKNCIIGALLGLFLSALFVILRYALDRTVKGEEDLKNILDIPVLGEIPDLKLF